MHTCSSGGHLVDGSTPIPRDATDFEVSGLPVVGCSAVRCTACRVPVRNAPALAFAIADDVSSAELSTLYDAADLATSPLLRRGDPKWRLYICRCSRWLETSRHACAEPSPGDRDPSMPWRCGGHPPIVLPHDVDGMVVDSHEALRRLALDGFRELVTPPRIRSEDKVGAAWLARLVARLRPEDGAIVVSAAMDCLDDPKPRARALALRFFHHVPHDDARTRVLDLFLRKKELFARVPDDVTPVSTDATLADTAWRIFAPLVEAQGPARDLARAEALGGTASVAVYEALAKYDSAWVTTHGEDLARGAPHRVDELLGSLAQSPSGIDIGALKERIRKAVGTSAAKPIAATPRAPATSTAAAAPAGDVLTLQRYTPGARQLVASAQRLADERHHRETSAIHILAKLVALEAVQKQLVDVGADPLAALKLADDVLASRPKSTEAAYVSRHALVVLKRAESGAQRRPVGLTDVLHACIEPEYVATIGDLDREGVEPAPERTALARIVRDARLDRVLPRVSPGAAFLLAYLPAQHCRQRARRELLDRIKTEDRALKHALDFARRAFAIEESKIGDANVRLAAIATKAGIPLVAAPTGDPAAWLDPVPDAVRPHLKSPLLEAAWTAGETARAIAVAAAVLAQLAYLRNAAPENPELRAEGEVRASEATDGAATLRAQLESTGLPLVISAAGSVAKLISLSGELVTSTTGGHERLKRLSSELDGFFDAIARKLDVSPPPKATGAPTPEEDALLARIIADPNDHRLRAELATLAARRHDPRAELIALQLSSAADAGQKAFELVQSHPEWTAPLVALGAQKIKVAAGFPDEITIDAEILLTRGAELLAAAPLTKLRVRKAKGRVAEVVRSPRLTNLTLLDLDDQGVTDDDLVALAASPYVTRLRQLELRYNPISARGIHAIAGSPQLRGLQTVSLDGNPADPVDRQVYIDERNPDYVATEAGEALEAKYGRLRWLHPGSPWTEPTLAVAPPAVPPAPAAPAAAPVKSREPVTSTTATCAACGVASEHPRVALDGRAPKIDDDASGLDGRPSYAHAADRSLANDAAMLSRVLALAECPACGHIAPWIDVAFPRIASAKEARAAVLALTAHSELARRYLYVAQLYGDADPREEGLWVLRAAWADEAAGLVEPARALRLRAGVRLEDALYQGFALARARGASSIILTEIFRVAGDFRRAAEHCLRGMRTKPSAETKRALKLAASHIVQHSTAPLSRARVAATTTTTTSSTTTSAELFDRLAALCPEVSPVRLRPTRRFAHPRTGREWALVGEAAAFVSDFLDAELMLALLRDGRSVWPGVIFHQELLPALLEATDHEDHRVRKAALSDLFGKPLARSGITSDGIAFDPEVLRGKAKSVAALVRRLGDDDDTVVRSAVAILRHIFFLDSSFAPAIAVAARAALPRWSSDPQTKRVLENLIEMAPPEGLIGGPRARARTVPEMTFAASLRPCPTCGAAPGPLTLSGIGDGWTLAGICPYCASERVFNFYTYDDPQMGPAPARSELGDARASEIVTAPELRAELERLTPLIAEALGSDHERNDRDGQRGTALRERALTCVVELLKHGPDAALEVERDRLMRT